MLTCTLGRFANPGKRARTTSGESSGRAVAAASLMLARSGGSLDAALHVLLVTGATLVTLPLSGGPRYLGSIAAQRGVI
jgi:hypothetical protein